jgi:hypothetical protein
MTISRRGKEEEEEKVSSFLDPKRTLLGALFPERLPVSAFGRALRLFFEAALVTAVSIYLPVVLQLDHAGLISVFLVSAALSDRLTLILEENRQDIRVRHRGGWESNTTTAVAILFVFFGMTACYGAVAYTISDAAATAAFSFTSQLAGLEGANLLTRDFGSVGSVLFNNLGVVVVIAFLAFLYRSYGAMLVLAWNACVWGFVFSVLTVQSYRTDALADVPSIAVAYAGVLPHLTLETTAYVLVSLSFLFGSKALGTYKADDPRFRQTMLAAGTLVGFGLLALLAAAFCESYLAPAVLSAIG